MTKKLKEVKTFTYLGVTLSSNGSFYHAQCQCYGSEIWDFNISPDIGRVYLKFLKQILGGKQQTCCTAVYEEFGAFPLYIVRKIRIIKFWYEIKDMPYSTMYKFMTMQGRNETLLNSWSCNLKE
jgi:hypothetical protein